MTVERVDGETPAGGAYSVATWLDDNGNQVEKDAASRVIVREFDSADRLLAETWGELGSAGDRGLLADRGPAKGPAGGTRIHSEPHG